MSKKLVFELSIYDDGDWRYDESIFKGCTSRYFDNDLYEYTLIDDEAYTTKVRRTFDNIDEGFSKIVELLRKFTDSIESSRDIEYIKDFFKWQIKCLEKKSELNDFYDSNTEIDIKVNIVDNDSKPIKEVIFEDGTSLSL